MHQFQTVSLYKDWKIRNYSTSRIYLFRNKQIQHILFQNYFGANYFTSQNWAKTDPQSLCVCVCACAYVYEGLILLPIGFFF